MQRKKINLWEELSVNMGRKLAQERKPNESETEEEYLKNVAFLDINKLRWTAWQNAKAKLNKIE